MKDRRDGSFCGIASESMKYLTATFMGFLLALVLTPPVRGGETVRLEQLVNEAKENNTEIKALTQKFLASKQQPVIAMTWEYPQVGFEKNDREEMFWASQMFPFPGKRSLMGSVARYDSKIAEQELNSKTIEVVGRVKKAYIGYWLTEKTIEIYGENIDLMKGFLNVAKTLYAVGKVTQADILKASIKLSEMEKMLVQLDTVEKRMFQSELNTLVNQPPETPVGRTEKPSWRELNYKYDDLKNLVLENSPEIKSKFIAINKNADALSLSKLEWFPDIMAGVKTDNMSNSAYMAQFAVPIYFQKQISSVKMARREKDASEQELKFAQNAALEKLRNLSAQYEAAKKTLTIYETSILPLAKQTLEITGSGYRAGKNTFLDLLDSQEIYLNYTIDYYKQLAQKEMSFIGIENLIGITLQ